MVLVAIGLLTSQLLLKVGIRGETLSLTSMADLAGLLRRVLTTPALLAGYIFAGAAAMVWLVVLSRLELSYAVPLLSAVYYLLLPFVSYLLLHEQLTSWRWAGTLLIFLGMLALFRDQM